MLKFLRNDLLLSATRHFQMHIFSDTEFTDLKALWPVVGEGELWLAVEFECFDIQSEARANFITYEVDYELFRHVLMY